MGAPGSLRSWLPPVRVGSRGKGQMGGRFRPQPPHTHRIVMIFTKSRDRWFSCAMNTAATHWKSAAPSMLTVAPMGRMKRLMCLATPFLSSTHFIISGSVAELRGGAAVSMCPTPCRSPTQSTAPWANQRTAGSAHQPRPPTHPPLPCPPQPSMLYSSRARGAWDPAECQDSKA